MCAVQRQHGMFYWRWRAKGRDAAWPAGDGGSRAKVDAKSSSTAALMAQPGPTKLYMRVQSRAVAYLHVEPVGASRFEDAEAGV